MPWKDKERQREASRRWNAERRREVSDYVKLAKANPCVDCGNEYPHYVMHFHHLDGSTKIKGVSDMIRNANLKTLGLVKEEISKCVLLCANCHALRHGERGAIGGSGGL